MIDTDAEFGELTAPYSTLPQPPEPGHMDGDVCDVLRTRKMMLVSHPFHAEVPTLAVAEIHELFRNHAIVLPGDARHLPVRFPSAVRAMARNALAKKFGAM